ncbi:MAG: acyl carrier protein [Candidatus Riflebacteria bacterium]|nr:acyl carrier protein [Candidatus Riflebacteria bacterium]
MNADIFAKVQDAFQEALGIPRERITFDANIIDDLGSDSLDLLDILFALEEKFGIKIKRGQIEAMAREGIPDGEFEKEGCLTAKGAERLRQILSDADPQKIVDGMPVSRIPYLFTVGTFYRLVEHKLAEKASNS